MHESLREVFCRAAVVTVACLGATQAQSVVFYDALDAAVGPADPRPNSDGAASAFDAAAVAYGDGILHTLDFESVTLGDFLNLSPAETGVAGLSILPGGESSGVDTSITNQTVPVSEGYNTTPGGVNFLKLEENQPGPGVEPPVGIVFEFARPVIAFGGYFSGADSLVPGTITASFDNGQFHSVSLDGSPGGGIQFWGFIDTDPNAAISRVTILASPESGINTDVISIDDLRWVHIPEPGVPLLLLVAGLMAARRRRCQQ